MLEKEIVQWIGTNWGLVGLVIIVLLLNGKQVVTSIEGLAGRFMPSIAQALKDRESTERKKQEDRHEIEGVEIANAQANLSVVLSMMIKNQDRLLTQFERTLDQFWQDRQDDRNLLDKAIGEIGGLKQGVMSMTTQLSLHSMAIAKLSDDVEDLRNGKAAI